MGERQVTYLVMVTTNNNNKYYRMIPDGNSFKVEFGRVGCSPQTSSYSMGLWDTKYREKIAKGYLDQTELHKDLIIKEKSHKSEYREIDNKAIASIITRLQTLANLAIQENYTISSNMVTQAMVDEAQNILTILTGCFDVTRFNEVLLKLFTTIPRKMSVVSGFLARSSADFGIIINKEQDLLDVMRGQVIQHTLTKDENEEYVEQDSITILEAMGIELEECSINDIAIIKMNLGSCADKFHQAWKVKNNKTQLLFDKFVQNEGGINTKLLWHGSRNENWWSIINSGLVLKPTNAVITGKMFGFGIYFATNARKSLGYTSLSGSYWAKGNEKSAFMSLYEVAYGNPFNVHSFNNNYYNFTYEKLQKVQKNAHCLHAHEGQMLRNDEIIVYQEAQTTIKYLVELKG